MVALVALATQAKVAREGWVALLPTQPKPALEEMPAQPLAASPAKLAVVAVVAVVVAAAPVPPIPPKVMSALV